MDSAQQLPLLSRLDAEPIVLLGLTRSEFIMIIWVSTLAWVPLMLLIMLWIGRWTLGVPIGFGAVVATLVVAGVTLSRVKRRRPAGYYQLWLRLRLEDAGLLRTGLIRRAGLWDNRHQRRYSILSAQFMR